MGLFKKSEKQLKIEELEKRLEILKSKANPNMTNVEYEEYKKELEQINMEMDELR